MAIRIDRVVTRGGDRGQTSLGNGARVEKDDPRIEALGTLDEANAVIGVLRAACPPETHDARFLRRIQSLLFDIGGIVCQPDRGIDAFPAGEAAMDVLETEIERLRAHQPPLRSFVLPGGTPAAAQAHLARTVIRRAERRMVSLHRTAPLAPAIPACLNRLSDYFFVLGRHFNADGHDDITWLPGSFSA
ncbi:cob(I)yrinic acid a,c-diamide adenosyltransferase [Gluconacetobacter entanii]|uniref:Corrinoid adenosyltransferase n=1 Tax=Gluconacetobacter entanii TaxID=108528 RepID=A0ABT3K6S9_9PROT|nr:cob(I)yrinic acid a,c-diamide adenosyltransferase [Gluconacetobacter entanii]MBE7618715.1 cob(I)yrinic acid a,c-diamide adenosyltransferase [Komagataeibacter sp. FXV2]MCW4591118.1 cob(I)yrinic acid a,c-diamide adenosyltransferase [Gluconacetobacter entanii]MCW4594492.1 cob(I)yrinic acid a,c-diamide adenosyltransferase [Gluconacetobacter entanii]NPC89531.1 cob(I)yrinic acid a,c-diamide adenosyltransferase [Gluconacetobacter entanii]